MQVTLTIPDTFAEQLIADGQDPSRAAPEALAVEGYRTQRLSESQVRQMLGYETRMEVHALLAEHNVCLHYSLADLETDAKTSQYVEQAKSRTVAEAVASIRELREGTSLGGLKIKDLIEEGRKY